MNNNDFSQMCNGALQLFTDNEAYDNYVEKFKPKKTSDDTFTPDDVYDAVAAYVRKRFGISEQVEFIRPFYPGGDYISDLAVNRDRYAAGVVVDNPPFSILAKIVDHYRRNGVRFFLFCPFLTCFDNVNRRPNVSLVVCNARITFTNGAYVNTSFVHNFETDVLVETAPDLLDAIEQCPSQNTKSAKPVIQLPANVLRQSSIGKLSHVPFSVRKNEAVFVTSVGNYDIFGGALIVSDEVAERVERAERAERAERVERAERAKRTKVVELTEKDRNIITLLNKRQ